MDIYRDENDDEFFPRPFEQGIWEWRNDANQLIFMRKTVDNDKMRSETDITPNSIHNLKFKLEIDLMEEQWFKKHYQRHFSADDVITLQDVKDVAFFTAPKTILSHDMISLLHLSAMDRFLRALIFYCQFYLQTSSVMAERYLQLQYKIKTARSQKIENTYRENLQDLRLLLAKEYSGLILGTGKYCKYHHMGVRRMRSLTKQDSMLFETILLISTHIVWIALGRKSFEQLELEIQRIFKSNSFNTAKHKLKTNFENEMSSAEHVVLFGHCIRKERMMALRSPLTNEMTYEKNNMDYRLLEIESMEYPTLNARLLYLKHILCSPEIALKDIGLSLGIIGLPHERFDTMLREIKKPTTSSSSVRKISSRRCSSARSSVLKSNKFAFERSKLYQDIILPEKSDKSSAILPEDFTGKTLPGSIDKNKQCLKWLRLAVATKQRSMAKGNALQKLDCK